MVKYCLTSLVAILLFSSLSCTSSNNLLVTLEECGIDTQYAIRLSACLATTYSAR